MKITLNLLLLLFVLNNYYYKNKKKKNFIQKFLGYIYNIFFLFQYIFIFLLKNKYIYIYFLYKYLIEENKNIINVNEGKNYIKNDVFLKKKKKISNYYNILNIYYRRRIYFGLTIVYIQILLRKIKEQKNYIIYIYHNK
jgi:hypothetical protein